MITAQIVRKDTLIIEVSVKGHSGYRKSGEDIVCAGVSSITQTALLGLKKVSVSPVDYTVNEEQAYLQFVCPAPKTREEGIAQQAILETMALGLKDIQEGFSSYLKVEDIKNVY